MPSAHGQVAAPPPATVPATVSTTATGVTWSSQASCRPRTSARSTPGSTRLSQSAVPSSPIRLAEVAAAIATTISPAQGSIPGQSMSSGTSV